MERITAYIETGYNRKPKIYIRVRIKKKYIKESLNIVCDSGSWDKLNQQVKLSDKDARDKNLIINQKKALANEIFIKYRLQNKELTPDVFRLEFRNPTHSIDFLEYLKNEILDRKNDISAGSYKHEMSFYNVMREWKKEIYFSEVNPEFVKKYARYLRVDRKNGIGRQMRQMKRLKQFTDLAMKKGYIKEDPFIEFKFKSDNKLPVFLEETELQSLIELYNSKTLTQSLQKVLRWYLFSCLGGGMRISDLRALTTENIISKKYIVFSPVKIRNIAAKTIRLELSQPAMQLLKDENRFQGQLFNMFCDQVINRHMKKIFAMAGIVREKISFHSSRHTFAVMYLMKMKSAMAFPTLSKILGHSTVQQTLDTYVGVTQLMLDEGMQNFNEFEIKPSKG